MTFQSTRIGRMVRLQLLDLLAALVAAVIG
jgi:hypothetical protein